MTEEINPVKGVDFNHTCTKCGHVDRLEVGVTIRPSSRNSISDWLATQSPETRKAVEAMERTGLLHAYEGAALEVFGHVPRNLAKALLTFFRCSSTVTLTPSAQLVLMEQFGKNHRFEVIQHTNVAALYIDDVLAMFAPRALFEVHALLNGGASRKVAVADISAASERIGNWIRMKAGYVPKEASVFCAALRVRSIGEFARAAAEPRAKGAGA